MNSTLVIFHLYYPEQLDWFLGRLSNIGDSPWDLLVTGPAQSPEVKEKILEFKPGAAFKETENVGYDIWPFISALKDVKLDNYQTVLKLHTKKANPGRTVHLGGLSLRGYRWRNVMVDAILGSREQFGKALRIFRDNADAGMVCSRELYTALNFEEDRDALDRELKKLGLQTPERRFCVGTTMMFRSSVLKALPLADIDASLFPEFSASDSGGTIAHVYERILSLLAPAQGYRVYTLSSVPGYDFRMKLRAVLKPVGTFIFNLDREGPQRSKYLTVLGIKIKLPG